MSDLHFIPDEPKPTARRGMRLTTLMVVVLVVGGMIGLMAPGTRSITLSDIRDGTSQTIMVVEVANIDIPWTEPRDLDACRGRRGPGRAIDGLILNRFK